MEKICKKCGKKKCSSEFYFTIKPTGKAYRTSPCKECCYKRNKLYQRKNADRIKAQKHLYHQRRVKDPVIKGALAADLKEWRHSNPEKWKAQRQRGYYKNININRERARRYYLENREQRIIYNKNWKINNKMRCKKSREAWCKANPEKYYAMRKATLTKRRAQARTTDITTAWLIDLKTKTGSVCPYCGMEATIWHLDHIVPLSRGGLHMRNNVMYCCMTCNLKKNNKSQEEFLAIINPY